MRGRQFKGTPESFAAYQPFHGQRSLQDEGIPLGPKGYLGDLAFFHPHKLPSNVSAISIEGAQDAGKSTFSKSMLLRCSLLQARDVNLQLEQWRTRIISRRSERGLSEYAPVAEYLGATIKKLGKGRRINLLGILQNPTDVIYAGTNIVQEINQDYVDPKIVDAITIAVNRLYGIDPALVGERMIMEALLGLTVDDFVEYNKSERQKSRIEFEKMAIANPRIISQLNLDYDITYIDESYLDAARRAAGAFKTLMSSAYGDVYGDTTSTIRDTLTSPVALIDTEDIPSKSDAILESIIDIAETSAMQYEGTVETGPNDPMRIVPHLQISEEEGVKMKSLMHARTTANKQAVQREVPTSNWRILQHGEIQLAMAGSAGSELRSLAKEIDSGYGARFVLRQADNDSVLDRYRRFMPQAFVELLPYLDNGQAFLCVTGKDPVLIQHQLVGREWGFIKSNFSRDRVAASEPIYEMDVYKDRMKRLLERQKYGQEATPH